MFDSFKLNHSQDSKELTLNNLLEMILMHA